MSYKNMSFFAHLFAPHWNEPVILRPKQMKFHNVYARSYKSVRWCVLHTFNQMHKNDDAMNAKKRNEKKGIWQVFRRFRAEFASVRERRSPTKLFSFFHSLFLVVRSLLTYSNTCNVDGNRHEYLYIIRMRNWEEKKKQSTTTTKSATRTHSHSFENRLFCIDQNEAHIGRNAQNTSTKFSTKRRRKNKRPKNERQKYVFKMIGATTERN